MKALNSLQIKTAINEIRPIIRGLRLEKIYQLEKKEFYFFLHSSEGTRILHFIAGQLIHLTNFKIEFPQLPSHFCMYLRKYIKNAVLRDIRQINNGRIIEIDFWKEKKYILIIELFSKGNVILCDDKYNILMPLEIQIWSERSIKPKEKYKYPPKIVDLYTLTKEKFNKILDSDYKIVTILARELGLGGIFSEEILKRAGINKEKPANQISKEEANEIFRQVLIVLKKIDVKDIEPNIVFEQEIPKCALPFVFLTMENKKIKKFDNFNNSLDFFYVGFKLEKLKELKQEKLKKRIEDLEKIKKNQIENLEKSKKLEEENRKNAEIISNNFEKINNIIQTILNSRKIYSWQEIKEKIEDERIRGVPEAEMIKEIIPEEGKIVLDINNIEIEFTRNLREIIDEFFENSKKYRAKIEKNKKIILEFEEKIKNIKEKKQEIKKIEEPVFKKIKKIKEAWYENFRWFFSSEGFLIISGRDATQNEILIRKQMEPRDIIFHTDIQGSPFTIVKINEKEPTEITLKEAGIQTASFSKAWTSGFGAIDVYWVKPHQLSKKTHRGEYLARGSFMIYGKKNILPSVKLELSLGIEFLEKGYRIISGPVSTIEKNSKYFVKIIPGYKSPNDLAKEIKKRLILKAGSDEEIIKNINIEDIQRMIPPGGEISY